MASMLDSIPTLAAISMILLLSFVTIRSDGRGRSVDSRACSWLFPAALSALFLAYSLWAIFVEGPTGFWTEHTRNMWGNQIWLDLLLAVGIAWVLMVPEAKALGMWVASWQVLVICTGCIGLTAMTARLMYLREHASKKDQQKVE
jgi:hypothetical protein